MQTVLIRSVTGTEVLQGLLRDQGVMVCHRNEDGFRTFLIPDALDFEDTFYRAMDVLHEHGVRVSATEVRVEYKAPGARRRVKKVESFCNWKTTHLQARQIAEVTVQFFRYARDEQRRGQHAAGELAGNR